MIERERNTINTLVERITPKDINVENAILGAIIIKSDLIQEVSETITVEAFYSPKNKIIFEAMLNIYKNGNTIDNITIANELSKIDKFDYVGGNAYITEIVSQAPVTSNVKTYANILQELYIKRKLINAGEAIATKSYDLTKNSEELIDSSEKILFDITQSQISIGYKPISDKIGEIIESIINTSETKKSPRSIPTGFKSLDNALAGFHKSDLIIIAARPSVGKTTFALDIARILSVRENIPVGIFSLEMSGDQLIERFLSAEAKVDAWRLRTGALKGGELSQRITEASQRLENAPIFIDDRSALKVLNIKSTARRMKRDHNIQLIIVDYLQLIQPNDTRRNDNLVQQITEISRTLKQIARELNIPVIALSQLSRDVEKRAGRPRLSDLRDSGSIEQDADVVMFLHRDDPEKDKNSSVTDITLLIEKHRNGPTGSAKFVLDKNYVTFNERDTSSNNYSEADFSNIEI